MNIDTTTIQKYARTDGFFYLFIILAGMFGQIIVRGSLVVPHDGPATVNQILTSMPWWRWVSTSFKPAFWSPTNSP